MIAAAWITVALLLCAVAALGVKVILLRRGARELREGLHERLTRGDQYAAHNFHPGRRAASSGGRAQQRTAQASQ